jgi:hypothetical protein
MFKGCPPRCRVLGKDSNSQGKFLMTEGHQEQRCTLYRDMSGGIYLSKGEAAK